MITFKKYLEEMSGQDIVARHMNIIPKEKHSDFRKHLAKARSNKMPLAAAIQQARVGIGESAEIDEDWKKNLAIGAVVAAAALGGNHIGQTRNTNVDNFEHHHTVLVKKDPNKAAELRKHLDDYKTAKTPSLKTHHYRQAARIVNESIELVESATTKGVAYGSIIQGSAAMGNTTAGAVVGGYALADKDKKKSSYPRKDLTQYKKYMAQPSAETLAKRAASDAKDRARLQAEKLKEETIEEMSKDTLTSAKEKALQRIQKALKKGDKHTAVKDAKFAHKVREKLGEDWREDRKKAAAKRAAELDADIKKNPVTPEEFKRAEKLLAGAIKAGKFMKDKMGA